MAGWKVGVIDQPEFSLYTGHTHSVVLQQEHIRRSHPRGVRPTYALLVAVIIGLAIEYQPKILVLAFDNVTSILL